MFLVDKQIASARAEFVQRDACQVRPMARCPSVPVRLFMHLSNNSRTLLFRIVSSCVGSLVYGTLFSDALQIFPQYAHSARKAFSLYFSLIFLE